MVPLVLTARSGEDSGGDLGGHHWLGGFGGLRVQVSRRLGREALDGEESWRRSTRSSW